MTCPGDLLPCNGNGQCLNMNQLAAAAKVSGDVAGFTYGATPNNPLTWDAFKVCMHLYIYIYNTLNDVYIIYKYI
jgi:hypothetical protein